MTDNLKQTNGGSGGETQQPASGPGEGSGQTQPPNPILKPSPGIKPPTFELFTEGYDPKNLQKK